jgi:hypothetical protein
VLARLTLTLDLTARATQRRAQAALNIPSLLLGRDCQIMEVETTDD